jgi:hypothetical protein
LIVEIAMSIALLGLLISSPALAFDAGEAYWAVGWCITPPCGLSLVVSGDRAGVSPTAVVDRSPGQVAWSAGNDTAFVTQYSGNSIVAVTSAGAVSNFASNIAGPTGLLQTEAGELLVVSLADAAVYRASAGGDLGSAPVFASGFGYPRNLLQLASGEILLADQGRHVIYDISAGGDFTAAAAFASGLPGGPYDLVASASGQIFVSTDGGVFEISSGGDFSSALSHASGRSFAGLAIDAEGRLLASDFDSGDVHDITAAGDYAGVTPFASNLPGLGDTALDSVPGASGPTASPVPAMEPTALALLTALLLIAGLLRTTRRTQAGREVSRSWS